MAQSNKESIDLEKALNPNLIRSNLMLSALYLTAYELLKNSICDRIKSFFSDPSTMLTSGKFVIDNEYKDEVTSLEPDFLYASCLWLKKMNVINEDEIIEIKNIRKYRNEIAHKLPELLFSSELNFDLDNFSKIKLLLYKIERWWITEFEVPINPEFDNADINPNDVRSGPMILLDHLISVVNQDL